jgi:hypothetical protein
MHKTLCFFFTFVPFPSFFFLYPPYRSDVFSGGLRFCLLSHAPLVLCLFDLLWLGFAFNCTESVRPSPLAAGDEWTLILIDYSLAGQPCFVFCKGFITSKKTG